MKQIKTNKIIFSVYQSNRPLYTNIDNHETLVVTLQERGVDYTEVSAMYKGITESSIMVESSDYAKYLELESLALAIARDFNQESILKVSNDDTVELHYLTDNRIESIGVLTEVDTLEGLEGYSIINNRMFTVKGK